MNGKVARGGLTATTEAKLLQRPVDDGMDNWSTADMFRRRAETVLYDCKMRGTPMTEEERKSVENDLECYISHMSVAAEMIRKYLVKT